MSLSPSNVCFISTVYHHILDRGPNSSELSDGLTYLGSHTRAEYALTLLTGNEYRTGLIQSWYRRFLARSAASGEVDAWLTVFTTDGTDEQIIAAIVSSNEYVDLPRVGATNSGYVSALYQDLLGRAPSPTELATWLTAMSNGMTRLQVAQAILASTEYRTDLIQGWYRKYLGRPATNDEITSGLSSFGAGAKDGQIIANLIGLDEYFDRAGICQTDCRLACVEGVNRTFKTSQGESYDPPHRWPTALPTSMAMIVVQESLRPHH
jgi:hypothetical protein